MLRIRPRWPGLAVARRVPIGSLVKRASVAGMVLVLAAAADSPRGEERGGDPDRVALAEPVGPGGLKPDLAAKAAIETPAARAIRAVKECRARFDAVDDYTCTFYKRERVDGRLTEMNVMTMKVRNRPHSVYFHFHKPNKGREAIYVAGRNDGLILAHDVGLTRLLAGTMRLDPKGARAMEGCRHPITSAGIDHLIDTVLDRWTAELHDSGTIITFNPRMRLGSSPCLLIEAVHPARKPQYYTHKVRLFIDSELGIPVRYEAYDWPSKPGAAPDLLEEYAYDRIKLNAGLTDADFDAANPMYAFGRF